MLLRSVTLVLSALMVLMLLAGCSERQPEPVPGPEPEPEVTEPDTATGLPALEAVKGTAASTDASVDSASSFTFWVWGDNRDGGGVFGEIVDAAAKADPKPAFVLSLGDIIEGEPVGDVGTCDEVTCDPETCEPDPDNNACKVKCALECYASTVAGAGAPIYNAPGNHEMIAKVTLDGTHYECPNADMHTLYQDNISPTLYGAFDYGNSRFIALNTDDLPVDCTNGKPCPVCDPCLANPSAPGVNDPFECSFVGQPQLDQLEADLAANSGKTHIFIMMHYPMPDKGSDNADRLIDHSSSRLHDIIKSHNDQYGNISFVLASHEHQFWNPQDTTNFTSVPDYTSGPGSEPYYLVSGGAGAPLHDPCENGDFFHYLTFTVDGDKVSVEIVNLGCEAPGDRQAAAG